MAWRQPEPAWLSQAADQLGYLMLVFLEHSADTPELRLHILTAAATVGQPQANPSLGILVLQ